MVSVPILFADGDSLVVDQQHDPEYQQGKQTLLVGEVGPDEPIPKLCEILASEFP